MVDDAPVMIERACNQLPNASPPITTVPAVATIAGVFDARGRKSGEMIGGVGFPTMGRNLGFTSVTWTWRWLRATTSISRVCVTLGGEGERVIAKWHPHYTRTNDASSAPNVSTLVVEPLGSTMMSSAVKSPARSLSSTAPSALRTAVTNVGSSVETPCGHVETTL